MIENDEKMATKKTEKKTNKIIINSCERINKQTKEKKYINFEVFCFSLTSSIIN